MEDLILRWATELQSLAQAGLYYGKDVFDRERYQQIRTIAAKMLAERIDLPQKKITELFCSDTGYQTPKVDTRAAIFNDGKILLVQETDGLWSLPGGWCEFNLSPVENVVKEAKEEAGVDVIPIRLIAAQDRNKHNKPPYPYGVVKLFYLCEAVSGQFTENIETTASAFFSRDALPPLSEAKCNEAQIALCFAALDDPLRPTQFD